MTTPAAAGRTTTVDQPARRTTVLALTTSVLIFGASVVIGCSAFTPGAMAPGGVFALEGSTWQVLLQILGRNLGSALLLFSGFALAGSTTVMGLMFTGTWVGAGFHAMASDSGLSHLSPLVLLYLPFEFTGLVVAGAAGLLPLVTFVQRSFSAGTGTPRRLSHQPALRLLALACGLIVIGALLETLVIRLSTS